MNRSRPPTLADVARAANVSTATASRAINAPDTVAKKTRARIDLVIDALGYTPNFAGSALASQRARTVGAVIPSLANAMFANGLQSFQRVLTTAGITLLVANSDYDPEREYQQIRALVTHGAAALMLIGNDRAQKTNDFMRLRGVPYVMTWCWKHDQSQLYAGFDNAAAARAMTERVLAAGHRNIAMIAGIAAGNDRARDRIAGVRQAIAAHGDGATLTMVVQSRYLLDDAAAAYHRVMAGPIRPTAIIGGSDVLAASAIVQAVASGLRVPQDVSVTGFDDIGLASVVAPSLTTVHVPQHEMGEAAARMLLARLSGDTTQKSVQFDAPIVMRGSLGNLPVN